jgi:hypothetical protein
MRLLVACEFSGVVREAFRARGHDAWSCDLLPAADNSPFHIQDDVLRHLRDGWDLMIAHPPCTYLSSSGLHWNSRVPGRDQKTEEAIQFVRRLIYAPIHRIAIENPKGCISTRIRPHSQAIQPYEFGDDAAKLTFLWLQNLPLLRPTLRVPGRIVNGKERWSNQTDSGQNSLGPTKDRWAKRSVTYKGIAEAMADQWGHLTGKSFIPRAALS